MKKEFSVKNTKNYILLGICGILATTSILLTIQTATSGVEISKIETKEQQLLATKKDLEESLIKTLSMNELQEKSGDLGFTKPSNLVYISSNESVAKLP